MLQALRNQGIRQIDGRLVLDRELFSPARLDVGTGPFDESPDAYYNVIPDALMVNKNMLLLDMRADGQKLTLAMEPALEGVTIESDMTLINGPCAAWEAGWKMPDVRRSGARLTVMLHGTFPRNCVASNSINVLDRHDYLDRLFRLTWKQLGGSIGPETVEGAGPADSRLLADHVARALPELLRDINKPSDNALARTLFLSLGSLQADGWYGSKPVAGNGPTLVRADMNIRAWLRARGIDDAGLVLENGSGLSRLERINAMQLGRLLQIGMESKWAPEFMSSLPIAGMDGTMRRRLTDSPVAGHARIKTGALKNAVAIAGYVPDANGKLCVVVGMINSDLVGAGRGRMVLDALINWVAKAQ
jgi:D-alanyl-D-alanine carboxypeptidase/D-alanyl-D-alanine-endopeptidase (penicillin-binding protein 4)